MRRYPRCRKYGENDMECPNCHYQYKTRPGKRKEKPPEQTDEWPSDEWKDWNTM